MQIIVYNRIQDYNPTQTVQAQTYLFAWQVILQYSKNADMWIYTPLGPPSSYSCSSNVQQRRK